VEMAEEFRGNNQINITHKINNIVNLFAFCILPFEFI
jgi:hypothetical protein